MLKSKLTPKITFNNNNNSANLYTNNKAIDLNQSINNHPDKYCIKNRDTNNTNISILNMKNMPNMNKSVQKQQIVQTGSKTKRYNNNANNNNLHKSSKIVVNTNNISIKLNKLPLDDKQPQRLQRSTLDNNNIMNISNKNSHMTAITSKNNTFSLKFKSIHSLPQSVNIAYGKANYNNKYNDSQQLNLLIEQKQYLLKQISCQKQRNQAIKQQIRKQESEYMRKLQKTQGEIDQLKRRYEQYGKQVQMLQREVDMLAN